jgi:hypothetical protein
MRTRAPEAPRSETVRSKFWRTTGTRAAMAKAAMNEVKKDVQDNCKFADEMTGGSHFYTYMIYDRNDGYDMLHYVEGELLAYMK